jgi:hypothetical protein
MTNHPTFTKTALAAALTLTGIVLALAVSPIGRSQPTPDDPSSPTALMLRTMVLGENELPGFTSVQCPLVQTAVSDWAGADKAAIPVLRANGFVMGIRESLHSAKLDAIAASAAINFRTAAGARNDLEQRLAAARSEGALTSFAVAGIAGAKGYRISTLHSSVSTIAFTDRVNEYRISVALPTAAGARLSESQLVHTALRLYTRAGGKKHTAPRPVVPPRHHQ